MNLTRMIFKNIKYNIKNYIAYLLGNSFVICILFLFYSLIFSKQALLKIRSFLSSRATGTFVGISTTFRP